MKTTKIILQTKTILSWDGNSTRLTRPDVGGSTTMCSPKLAFIRDHKLEVRLAQPGERTSVKKGVITFWLSQDEDNYCNLHFNKCSLGEYKTSRIKAFCLADSTDRFISGPYIYSTFKELLPGAFKQVRLTATIID